LEASRSAAVAVMLQGMDVFHRESEISRKNACILLIDILRSCMWQVSGEVNQRAREILSETYVRFVKTGL